MTTNKELQSKVDELNTAQEERVKTIQQIQERMSEMREAMGQIKEAHDYTRGQIAALADLLPEDTTKSAPAKDEKTG